MTKRKIPGLSFCNLPFFSDYHSNATSPSRNRTILRLGTQQSAIKTAREFVNAVVASGFPLNKAILFGSYIPSEQRSDSDIDLAWGAYDFIGVAYFDIKHFIAIKISQEKYAPIDTPPFNTDYFLAGDPFTKEIERTSTTLFEAANSKYGPVLA